MGGFVGRTDKLERLKQKIFKTNGRRIVSVLGLGGVGKSRLALELAYQIKSEHPQHSVFWIQAAEQLTFEKDILEIGKKLGIPGIEDDKADIKTLVKQRLSNQPEEKWFLVLDNADDEALWGKRSDSSPQGFSLVDHLPRTTNGSILITTRSRYVANSLAGKEVIELLALSRDEAAEMFTKRLETPHLAADRAILSTLLEKLTYLPLAIVQAASFMNMTQRPVQTYLELLDTSEVGVIKLLSKDFGDPSRYPNAINPVANTWLISFKRIRNYHPLAAAFLSSMACLHEKGIPRSLLPEAGSEIDEIDIIDAVAVLTGYSFVTRQTGSGITSVGELYDMHRLVQLAARNWLKMEGLLIGRTKVCITHMAQIFPTRDHKHKSIWTLYLPHAQRLCVDSYVEEISERYDLLEKMGLCLVVDGKYTEAVKMHTATVQFREDTLGASEKETLSAYNNLGEALNWKGNWSMAEEFLQQAVNGQLETLGPEDPSTLTSRANLASTYRNQGRWTQAEELEVQVMETRRRVLGAEYPFTLTSMANLASTYRN
jgi:tetratricopeptide (TPR) repeat protein